MARGQKQADDTAETGDLDSFVENRRHMFREVRGALRVVHNKRDAARYRQNATIIRPSAGVQLQQGDRVLVKNLELSSSLFRKGLGAKLVHEKWTEP